MVLTGALNGIMALFLGFPVVLKALFPRIRSGIGRYCGPLSGISSGIEGLFPKI